MADREKVIEGLEFTKAMITFDPSTGDDIEPENLNPDDKLTYDACVGAIALLKEQEPKVLTLEEVEERMNTNDDYDSVFYAEVRTLKRTSFGVFHLFFDSKDYYVAMLLGCSFPAWYRKESYGHKWRCWSAKPTNEQRKAVKWE